MLTNDRPTTNTPTAKPSRPSAGRMLGILVASGAGWVVGFYLGVFAVLTLVGWDDFAGWQFIVATIPGGALGASVAAIIAHPDAGAAAPPVFAAAAVAGVIAVIALQIVDGDYAVAILGGGAAVVGAVAASASATRGG